MQQVTELLVNYKGKTELEWHCPNVKYWRYLSLYTNNKLHQM